MNGETKFTLHRIITTTHAMMVLAAVTVIIGGVLSYTAYQVAQLPFGVTVVPYVPYTNAAIDDAQADTSTWQTYRNEEWGILFSYPEGLDVEEYTRDFGTFLELEKEHAVISVSGSVTGGWLEIQITATRDDFQVFVSRHRATQEAAIMRDGLAGEYRVAGTIFANLQAFEVTYPTAIGTEYRDILVARGSIVYQIQDRSVGESDGSDILSTFEFIE